MVSSTHVVTLGSAIRQMWMEVPVRHLNMFDLERGIYLQLNNRDEDKTFLEDYYEA